MDTKEGLKAEYETLTPFTERGLIHYSEWLEDKLVKNYVARSAFLVQHKETLVNHGLFDSEEKAKKYINGSGAFGIQEVQIA